MEPVSIASILLQIFDQLKLGMADWFAEDFKVLVVLKQSCCLLSVSGCFY